ncbi:M50 family metallopeptidase [Bacillus carboniphilus]|uniref:M50 family metallopeptidase n=1 Tax=Bacillus carboniphilus TaxID=86663 RepID=A0ABY9JXI1_9BACI|nr:M50 family metallopeptidase [Bacillus carboniphilus]WLR44081.1 M50 family metallopeptidase [Bacillus carboniphilus]
MTKYIELIMKVHIHPLLWVVMGIGVMTGYFKPLLILVFIVFIHEMGHALCAYFYGWRIKKVLLLPFGGYVEVEEHGNRPMKEELFVTISGPIQHVWMLASMFFLSPYISQELIQTFTIYNVMVFLFNLLPIWPLDGGKILFILLCKKYSFYKSHQYMLVGSLLFITILVIILCFFAISQLNNWLIVSYLIYCVILEYKQRQFTYIRFLLERYYGKKRDAFALKPLIVDINDSIMDVLIRFHKGYKHPIIVMQNGEKEFELDENELLHVYFSDKKTSISMTDLKYVI